MDLIISTISLADKINVEVCDETWGSDHFPIFIQINANKQHYEKKSYKLKSVRTNWTSFVNDLNKNFSKFLTHEFEELDPKNKYTLFVETISNAVTNNTPKKSSKKFSNKNSVYWWDAECDKIKRLRRASYKKWTHTCNIKNLIDYKNTQPSLKYL